MIAQLVLNYGQSTKAIPWSYLIYGVGSIVAPVVTVLFCKWTRQFSAKRDMSRKAAMVFAEQQEKELFEKSVKDRDAYLRSNLPGRWYGIYQNLKQIPNAAVRAETLCPLIRGGSNTSPHRLDPAKNPLPAAGAAILCDLIGDSYILQAYLPAYICESIVGNDLAIDKSTVALQWWESKSMKPQPTFKEYMSSNKQYNSEKYISEEYISKKWGGEC